MTLHPFSVPGRVRLPREATVPDRDLHPGRLSIVQRKNRAIGAATSTAGLSPVLCRAKRSHRVFQLQRCLGQHLPQVPPVHGEHTWGLV